MRARPVPTLLIAILATVNSLAAEPSPGDRMLADYFRAETARIRQSSLTEVQTLEDWQTRRSEYRRQLLEMLGLDPLPARSELRATVTGRVERDDFIVEKVHFQSSPGLYVTGDLYLPRQVSQPLPAILYLCGHGAVKKDNVSYGNKVHYQHHGAWFARNGYACLTIDSLQLGEIEGIHHGTYRYDMWWWLCRGYTPAGVEAWNCLRAIDYLQSRPEVDPGRIGVTGRSGGGAYSWWIAAIDDRVQAAVPVAGITDLENHVVDGCVEGHCDCMYLVNTYRWDYPQVAALVAPRPLLISNTDRDSIFPLEGVVRTHRAARRIYELHSAPESLALQITAGGHVDTQELHIHAFRWFNHYLRQDDSPIDKIAQPYFTPEELKVFPGELPADEINTRIAETFVPAVGPFEPPGDAAEWQSWKETWQRHLAEKVFRGWPSEAVNPGLTLQSFAEDQGLRLEKYEYKPHAEISLPLFALRRIEMTSPSTVELHVVDDEGWQLCAARVLARFPAVEGGTPPLPSPAPPDADMPPEFQPAPDSVVLIVPPRGIGPTAWTADEKYRIQAQRRFYLLGQTLDGMRVWDVVQARRAVRAVSAWANLPVEYHGARRMAGVALYAALTDEQPRGLVLESLPRTHRDGPWLLNVQRFLDLPHAVAWAADRIPVRLSDDDPAAWAAVAQTGETLQWPAERFVVHKPASP